MNPICEPWGADELAWMGIEMMGCANNHAKDHGEEGRIGTLENLRRVGISPAGTGPDLQEAARPCYRDTAGGRVAEVNFASTFPLWSLAAYTTPRSNGRPGLNPLPVDYTYQVDPRAFEALQRVIAVARRKAQLVIATIHAHAGHTNRELPAPFLQPLARACIDAGADAFFAAGPHVLRGIEVYEGKPIFYSLGNFFFQYETVKQIPAEVFEANELDFLTLDPSISYDKFQFPNDGAYWESVVPYITDENGRVTAIQLHPVVLGQREPRYERGTPVLATREEGRSIIERLARLSSPLGTPISMQGGVGHVQVRDVG